MSCNVYAEQLFPLGHGYPLWDPEPTAFGEVLTGDVGYIFDGRFFRLFNATREEDDQVNERGVPEGYIPFRYEAHHLEQRAHYMPAGPKCSSSVKLMDISAEFGAKFAGGGIRFQCTNQEGAVLMMKESAMLEQLHPHTGLRDYIARNYRSWSAFARNVLDLELTVEDIIFVRGWVKTADWAVAAFMHNSSSAELTFHGQFGGATAAFSLANRMEFSTMPEYNTGPLRTVDGSTTTWDPAIFDDHSERRDKRRGKRRKDNENGDSGDGKRRKHNHHSAEAELTYSSRQHESDIQRDQCIFLRYYKIKERLGIWPKVMKAAATPHDASHGPPGDDDSNSHLGDLHNTEPLEDIAEDDVQIDAVPALQKACDPVSYILDYVLLHSEASVAIATDMDMISLRKLHDTPILNTAEMAGLLTKVSPSIDVDENGAGILNLSASAIDHTEDTGLPSGLRISLSSSVNPIDPKHAMTKSGDLDSLEPDRQSRSDVEETVYGRGSIEQLHGQLRIRARSLPFIPPPTSNRSSAGVRKASLPPLGLVPNPAGSSTTSSGSSGSVTDYIDIAHTVSSGPDAVKIADVTDEDTTSISQMETRDGTDREESVDHQTLDGLRREDKRLHPFSREQSPVFRGSM